MKIKKSSITIVLGLIVSGLMHLALFIHYDDESVTGTSDKRESVIEVIIALAPEKVPVEESLSRKTKVVQNVVASDRHKEEKTIKAFEDVSIKKNDAVSAEEKVFFEKQEVDQKPVEKVSSANESEDKNILLSLIYKEINKYKTYPYQAVRLHREGRVKVNFTLHPDGRVSQIVIVESSRFNVLDRAARKAVESISPFLMAVNYLQVEREFNVDIDYRLN